MKKARLLGLPLAALLAAAPASAEIPNKTVKIGVLSDLSGTYEQNSGKGSVEAAKMAAEEFGNKINGATIEILAGDHQNKADVGVSIANRWFDVDKVDAITDLVNSAIGFAVVDIAKAKNKTVLLTSAGSSDFTGKACAPDTSVHWVYDTYEIGNAIGEAVPQLGKSWFFISADYAYGRALQQNVEAAVKKNGATVSGTVFHALGATDFSSFILQAQASGAKVVAINNGGDDAINAVKSAQEFGLTSSANVVPFGLDSLPAIKSLGLDIGQGLQYVSPWTPDISPEARAFMEAFIKRRGVAPSSFQVGTYSAVRAYLKAVEATNSTDPKTVIRKMRETPVHDAFTNNGVLRADGRMVHDVFLVQIKKPSESTGQWDLLKTVATVPGDRAFRPLSEGGCPGLGK